MIIFASVPFFFNAPLRGISNITEYKEYHSGRESFLVSVAISFFSRKAGISLLPVLIIPIYRLLIAFVAALLAAFLTAFFAALFTVLDVAVLLVAAATVLAVL